MQASAIQTLKLQIWELLIQINLPDITTKVQAKMSQWSIKGLNFNKLQLLITCLNVIVKAEIIHKISSLDVILRLVKLLDPADTLIFFDWDGTIVREGETTLIEPTSCKKLFRYLIANKIHFAFITGRFYDSVCDPNKRNLQEIEASVRESMYPILTELDIDISHVAQYEPKETFVMLASEPIDLYSGLIEKVELDETDDKGANRARSQSQPMIYLRKSSNSIYTNTDLLNPCLVNLKEDNDSCIGIIFMGIIFGFPKGQLINKYIELTECHRSNIIFIDDRPIFIKNVALHVPTAYILQIQSDKINS